MEIRFSKNSGYTLIEVLMVVVIVSLLATVALPSYQDQMMRTRRADGKTMLLEVMQAQERYFTEELIYTKDLTQLGYGDKRVPSHENFYLVSAHECSTANPVSITECIELKAEPVGAQFDDGILVIDSYGNQNPPEKWKL
ncbi:type IV pilin protein [Spartinivicinus ruber]|uniref:type IV pilin protein n=1 Tax=Spartinivicinus ruber TaxID=2683272 RepID=UPI0013D4220D|nr:type IV pilin protein [Spartinivicinus ruber]